ncbi:MAG TPA: tetratricopeptide repeat protein [Anaerolineae bacterium]|nr:tetratricopeptide repeat protein [Anaerolineae bacterium]
MPDPDRELLQAIAAYVPRAFVYRMLETPETTAPGVAIHENVALLFADVSGFTPMSEKLATLGKEGAEELTRVLNDYFSTMIALIHRYGGSIIKFGGDAMTCRFAAAPAGIQRACACALAMQAEMAARFDAVPTRAGAFALRMKIGVSAGPVLAVSVGTVDEGLEYVLAGRPLDRMAEGEHHATAGEVVIDASCLDKSRSPEFADPDFSPESRTCSGDFGLILDDADRDGFRLVRGLSRPVDFYPLTPVVWADLAAEPATQIMARLQAYLPPAVYERLAEGQRGFVGEHRQVVSLFVIFAGLDYDDDPQAAAKLQHYFTAMQASINRYGGRLNRVITGDKGSLLHVIFGAPVAHEDNEIRAVGCALELQDKALRAPELNFITEQRIGIASGYVFAGNVGSEQRREYTVMGDVVNLSARLMQAAPPGAVWMERATAHRVEQAFVCEALPPVHVKGKQEPIPIWQAVARRKTTKLWAAAHPPTPLVGREAEMTEIRAAIAQAAAGKGQLIAINGEAGVGKSRVLIELVALAYQRGTYALGGDCLSYGSRTPYLPWIDLFNDFFDLGATEEETPEDRIRRIERRMGAADPALQDWAPLMAQMVGLPMPDNEITGAIRYEVRKQRTFEIVLSLLRYQATLTPLLLLVIEDVHWIDEVSLELLNYVARNLDDSPILLVALHRPTLELEEWPRYAYYHRVDLVDLPAESALELARYKLNLPELPDGLREIVLRGEERVNPYFVEEVLNALIDQGYLVAIPGENGRDEYLFTGDLAGIELPNSIQALVMSRIDRLDESSKLSIKVASVVGRTFEYRTVEAMYPVPIEPARLLGNLEKLHRLELTPLDKPGPDWIYLFKHVTTQEVAYETLLYAHRRDLHRRLAEYLERQHQDNLAEYYELLAYHYTRSEDPEKSWEYLIKAGDKARGKYANEAAIAYYQQALALNLATHDPYPVYEALGDVYRLTGQYEQALETYEQALPCSREDIVATAEIHRKIAKTWMLQGQYGKALQSLTLTQETLKGAPGTVVLARIYNDMALLAALQGDYEKALEWCGQGVAVGNRLPLADSRSQEALAELQNTLGRVYVQMGDYPHALEHFQQCIDLRGDSGDLYGMVQSYNNLAAVYWGQGDYDLVTQYINQSLEISRRIGHTYAVAMSHNNLGVLSYTLGDYPHAIEQYERSLAIRKEIGDLQGIADIYNNLGEVYHALGDLQQSLTYLKDAAQLFTELGDKATLVDAYRLLAEVELESADTAAAQDYAQRALALAQETGNREYEGIVTRLLAQIADTVGQMVDAAIHAHRSVELLADIGNRLELGRSEYELGRILLAQSDPAGREHLQAAIAIFETLGVEKELEKARRAMRTED